LPVACWLPSDRENACPAGFDLILQDTVFWPGALLGELLDIPIVEVLPLPIMTHKEYEMSFPNPVAYAPQMGLAYTPHMVRFTPP